MSKKLIIFDCDGTLVDSEIVATKVFPNYWASHGVHFTADEFKEKFIGTGRNAPIVIETFSKMPSHANEEGDALFDEALAKELEAVPGILDLLNTMSLEMCVASNSSLGHVKRALKKTEMDIFFGDWVFSAEFVENPKPAADLFLYAADRCGYAPEDCIVVEDSVSGILAAKNAGMKVIGFCGASHFVPSLVTKVKETAPDYFCSTTLELEEVLISLQF